MALVLNNTPLDPTCNSYASIAEGDEYVATRVQVTASRTAWAALTADDKAMYLINASRALDSFFDWVGDRYSRDQGLKWPRANAYVDGWLLDNITFPRQVIEATIEMAVWSMENSGATVVTGNAQFDSIEVGPINIDFNESSGLPARTYFPDVIVMLLKGFGNANNPDVPSAGRMRIATLVRS